MAKDSRRGMTERPGRAGTTSQAARWGSSETRSREAGRWPPRGHGAETWLTLAPYLGSVPPKFMTQNVTFFSEIGSLWI